MLIIEIAKSEVTGGHISVLLIIEITKIALTGGYIRIMLVIDFQIRINQRPYWYKFIYRDGKKLNVLAVILK